MIAHGTPRGLGKRLTGQFRREDATLWEAGCSCAGKVAGDVEQATSSPDGSMRPWEIPGLLLEFHGQLSR